MYERTHKNTLTTLMVLGHIAIFLYAFALKWIFGGTITVDFVQMILMASPVLVSAAALAFADMIGRRGRGGRGKRLPPVYVILTLLLPTLLIILVCLIFTAFALGSRIATLEQLKISLGATETVFGGYIGVMARSIFSDHSK